MPSPEEFDEDGLPESDQDDSLPANLEEQRDEIHAEHDKVLDDLGPPPDAEGARAEHDAVLDSLDQDAPADAIRDEHDAVLDELSGALADEPAQSPIQQAQDVPLDESVALRPPQEKQGRYYVPPAERKPANREDRRAEHDRVLSEMRQSVENEMDAPATVEEFTDEFSDRQQEGFDAQTEAAQANYKTGQSRTNQATLRMFETLSGRDMDIAHELEQMRMRLERDRL
jgi:hypothetical protein